MATYDALMHGLRASVPQAGKPKPPAPKPKVLPPAQPAADPEGVDIDIDVDEESVWTPTQTPDIIPDVDVSAQEAVKAVKTPPERSTYWDFSEWEKRQPGYGKVAPQPEEEGLKPAAPGTGSTIAEQWQAYKRHLEESESPDEFVGLDAKGKPVIRRRPTHDPGSIDEPPPRPVGIPPDGDGPIDKAMDIYRAAADNYPHGRPIDEQRGFAVAASTQDYNEQGYAREAPVAAAIVEYDGREGEVREYDDGSRFFVSFEDDVILRMADAGDD